MIYIRKLSEKNIMVFTLIFLIAFFIILIIWYCNKEDIEKKVLMVNNTKLIETSNNINIGLYDEKKIENINPIVNSFETIRMISNLVFSGLFEYSDEGILKSDLVLNYAKIDDKNYVFKLKENIYFSNGQVLTSENIKNTVEKIYLNKDCYYNKFVENIQSIKIIDKTTFRINLIKKEDDFEKNLIFPIVCDELNIGTGKYKIKVVLPEKVVLESVSKELNQVINIYIYNDKIKLYEDFKSKKIDLIQSVSDINYKKILGEFGYKECSYRGEDYVYLEFNLNKLFSNKKIIEAVMFSINKSEIIDKVYNNNVFEVDFIEYNLDKTINILEELKYVYNDYGWCNNGEVFEINILLNEKELTKLKIAYIIKEQLSRVGINVEITSVNDNEYKNKLKNNEYDCLILDAKEKSLNEHKKFLICNKLNLLYSFNMSGEIRPTEINIFHNISTWKKIISKN